jgi:hypothetical protein
MPDITGSMQACEAGPGGNWDAVNWNEMSWPVPGANGDTFASEGIVSDINGAMAALETGDDVLAATGDVLVAGAMAATETGDDVFVATGEAVETGVMYALETGDDAFASTGQVEVSGTFYAQETGSDVFAAVGEVGAMPVLRGGYGKDYKKPKQREFKDELTARAELREKIRRLIDPVKEEATATILAAQEESAPGVAIVTAKQSVTIPVPPQFSASQVARMVANELERVEVSVRTRRARVMLEAMVREERARIARLRRDEEELLLLA